MTMSPRFEQDLPVLLEDLYLAGTPDYRDDLVQRVAATRQRPTWTFPERWFPMDVATQAVPTARFPWRQAAVLALLLLLLAVVAIGIVGAQRRLAEPYGIAANGQLAYVVDGDVYVRETLDAAPRLLVGGPEVEVDAWFSPRGDRLLVIRAAAEGAEELWVGDADGSDLHQVGADAYVGARGFDFSPDGALLAVQHEVDHNLVIDLVPTDGGAVRRVPANRAESPLFRPPDGRQLVFRGLGDDGLTWGFYLVDLTVEGALPVRLAIDGDGLEGGTYDLWSPAWSPTGDRLAYHSLVELPLSAGQTPGFRLRVASIDDAGQVTSIDELESEVTSDDEMNPVFTQDGRSLLFQQRYGLLGITDYTDSAWIWDLADGRDARPLGVETANGDGFWIAVAPDDRSLIVHLHSEEQDWLVDRAADRATRTDLESSSGVAIQRRAP